MAKTRSFGVFFDLRLNNPLSKQSQGWGLKTLSRPLWRHCNVSNFREIEQPLIPYFATPWIREVFWGDVLRFNTLRPRQNERRFADDIFKCIYLNENVWISIKISLNFVPQGPINNIPALVQIMAWRRPGDKPLSEPMVVSLPTHICVTRPQWVNARHRAGDHAVLTCGVNYKGIPIIKPRRSHNPLILMIWISLMIW